MPLAFDILQSVNAAFAASLLSRDVKASKLVTPPVEEPISLSEAKEFMRITSSDDDALITALIPAARLIIESYIRQAIIEQTWDLSLDFVPGDIWLQLYPAPLREIVHVQTEKRDGTTETDTTLSNYRTDTNSEPGRIILKEGETWPIDLQLGDSFRIRFKVGIGVDASEVDEALKTACKMLTLHLYENRDVCAELSSVSMPMVIKALLHPYIVMRF